MRGGPDQGLANFAGHFRGGSLCAGFGWADSSCRRTHPHLRWPLRGDPPQVERGADHRPGGGQWWHSFRLRSLGENLPEGGRSSHPGVLFQRQGSVRLGNFLRRATSPAATHPVQHAVPMATRCGGSNGPAHTGPEIFLLRRQPRHAGSPAEQGTHPFGHGHKL